MDTENIDITLLSTEAIKLYRNLHTQKEYCKNLDNVYKSLIADIKAVSGTNVSTRDIIQDVIKRENHTHNSICSTNKSAKLVDDLLCDLKKQLQLEHIRTSEQYHRLNTNILRYEAMWNNYQNIYMTYPLAPEATCLYISVKCDFIKLAKFKVELAEGTRKIKTIERIKEKQNQMKILQMATLFGTKKMLVVKKEALLTKVRKLYKIVAALKQEKLELQQHRVIDRPALSPINSVGDKSTQSQMIPRTPSLPQQRRLHILPSVEGQQSILPELPVLKIPIFNSPPRKVSRYTAASFRSLLYSSISSIRTPSVVIEPQLQPLTEPDPDPGTAIDVEHQYPTFSVNSANENNKDSDTYMEVNMVPSLQAQIIENELAEKTTEPEQEEDDSVEMYISEENNIDGSVTPAVMEQNYNKLDDHLMNEATRMSYLHRMKSPEFHFSARSWRSDGVCPGLSPSDNTSRYFQQPSQHEQVNYNAGQPISIEGERCSNVASTSNKGVNSNIGNESMECVGSPGNDYVDNLISQYASPTSSIGSYLSPTLSENYLNPQMSSAHQGAGDASGFCFNFATETSSKNMKSLFGSEKESEPEVSKGNSEAFNFSFSNKSKSSSFFKLF